MKVLLTYFFVLILGFIMQAQEQAIGTADAEPRVVVEDFSYPLFLNDEQHTSFKINFPISNTMQIELQEFYDTYLLTNRFRSSIALKQYLTEKLYLFAGAEIEIEYTKGPQVKSDRPPRVGIIGGIGYDVNSNFVIEAKSNIGINKTPIGAFGEPFIVTPQVYTLGSKIKF